jgi:hypothetical protein
MERCGSSARTRTSWMLREAYNSMSRMVEIARFGTGSSGVSVVD